MIIMNKYSFIYNKPTCLIGFSFVFICHRLLLKNISVKVVLFLYLLFISNMYIDKKIYYDRLVLRHIRQSQ